MPSKSGVARKLSQLEGFQNPDIELEQYVTPPALAADMVHTARMQGDIQSCGVVDLGTGTGVLAIGAALAGAEKVTAVEKDAAALEIARKNASKAGVEKDIEFVEADVREFEGRFDTCVMNPPFSVHSELGERFFRKAFSVSDSVYSLKPRDQSIKEFARNHGHEVLGVEQYSIELGPSYGFHTENARETAVDFVVTRRI